MAKAPLPAPAAAAPAADLSVDDIFDNAFKELTDEGQPTIAKDAGDVVTAEAQAANDAAAAAADKAAEGALPDPGTVRADGTVEGEPAGDPPPPPDPAEQKKLTNEELLERFRSAVAEPPPAPAAAAPAAQHAEPAKEPSPVAPYSADEQAVLDAYEKEWPDVSRAEELKRSREYQAIVAHIFNQIRPILEGVRGTAQQLVQMSHLEQLEAAVPDYNEVAPKVLAWIDTQPGYLKAAYQHVAANGTVADVTDLIGRYRTAVGEQPPVAQAGAPAQTSQAAPAARKAAPLSVVKSLAPVTGKRTGVQQGGIAPDDFDGAFAEFAKTA